MADHSKTSGHASSSEDVQFVINEQRLPELIQDQIGKLNELDAGVKKALETAEKAEKRAQEARKLSAGWSLFNDRKKEAIEELQEVGVELAEAVQLGTHAQKISFEFQTRLAEVAKYLFTLGVGNIAANRIVVRELEMRLHGASEKELSELARQEVMSVVLQLKEQEDLLWKQEQSEKALRKHSMKIDSLMTRVDQLELGIKDQHDQHRTLASNVDTMEEAFKQQKEDISTLQDQIFAQQAGIETLASSLVQARSHAEDASKDTLKQISNLDRCFKEQDVQQHTIDGKVSNLEQVSQSQQIEILALKQQVVTHQKDLRWTVNVRTALFVLWTAAVSAAAYFLR